MFSCSLEGFCIHSGCVLSGSGGSEHGIQGQKRLHRPHLLSSFALFRHVHNPQ